MTDAQANGILSAIRRIDQRITGLEKRLTARFDTRFDALETRVSTLEEAVSANASKIDDMHNFTQRFYAEFQEFRAEMNGR